MSSCSVEIVECYLLLVRYSDRPRYFARPTAALTDQESALYGYKSSRTHVQSPLWRRKARAKTNSSLVMNFGEGRNLPEQHTYCTGSPSVKTQESAECRVSYLDALRSSLLEVITKRLLAFPCCCNRSGSRRSAVSQPRSSNGALAVCLAYSFLNQNVIRISWPLALAHDERQQEVVEPLIDVVNAEGGDSHQVPFCACAFWVSPKGANEFVVRARIILPVERNEKNRTKR